MIDSKTGPYGAFILRVSLGALLIANAIRKILVFPAIDVFFQTLGFPVWLAYFATFGELFGGIALILGFFARYIALLFFVETLAIIYTLHGSEVWLFTKKGNTWEYLALWAFAFLVLFLIGDGKWAIKKPSRF